MSQSDLEFHRHFVDLVEISDHYSLSLNHVIQKSQPIIKLHPGFIEFIKGCIPCCTTSQSYGWKVTNDLLFRLSDVQQHLSNMRCGWILIAYYCSFNHHTLCDFIPASWHLSRQSLRRTWMDVQSALRPSNCPWNTSIQEIYIK